MDDNPYEARQAAPKPPAKPSSDNIAAYPTIAALLALLVTLNVWILTGWTVRPIVMAILAAWNVALLCSS